MIPLQELAEQVATLNLITPRLRLRLTVSDDDPVQIKHEMNPAIMWGIRDPLPRAEVEERIRKLEAPWQAQEGSWVSLSLERSDTGDIIGFFFLQVVSYENQSVELGYRLHPDHWRRGYTFEAAQRLLIYCREELQVRKMIAYCVAANEGSAGVLEKLGFSREGCLRKHSPLGGRWCDELVYGLVLAPDREVPQAGFA
jgi:ribosomal-protein-alanine N-acetyltransferase